MNADLMDDDVLVRRYLLGELGEGERETVEQRLLADDDFFELTEAVEGDLLAAYARNEVSPSERERIIRRLASSRTGHARLALAQALNHFGDTRTVTQTMRTFADPLPFRRPEPMRHRPAVVRFATVAASLAAAVLAVVLVAPRVPKGTGATLVTKVSGPIQVHRPGALESPAAPPAQSLAATSTSTQKPRTAEPPAQPLRQASTVFVLAFSSLRSGGPAAEPLRIARGAQTVEIQMPLADEEPFRSYRVTVRDVSTGDEIWSGEARPRTVSGQRAVSVSLSAESVLRAGLFEVELRGLADGAEPELVGSSVVEAQRR